MSKEKNLSLWNNILKAALKLPGANVDREFFLRKELRIFLNEDELNFAIKNGVSNISVEILDKIANETIKYHTKIVSAISFTAGLPGGIAMLASIPADFTQFYWHVMVLAQKLSYIYGWPDFCEKGAEISDEFLLEMSLFIGVMYGIQGANKAINAISKALATQIEKCLPQITLTKIGVFQVATQIAAFLGIKFSKEAFAKSVSKAIPIVGGVVSGSLTLATFSAMSKRLKNELKLTDFMKKNQNGIENKNF